MSRSLLWMPKIGEKRARVMAAMSYCGVLCFVPLLFKRDDEFVNFHARQGVVLWIWLVLAFFTMTIPGLGWFFLLSSSFIIVMSLYGIVSALLLYRWKLPLVSYFAECL